MSIKSCVLNFLAEFRDHFRARYGATAVVGGLMFVLLLALDHWSVISIVDLTVADTSVRSALFGALIAVCGLFLAVWLAILAGVMALGDDRPVVKLMKQHGRYEELVHRLVGPVFIVLLLALASVICIILPGAQTQSGPPPSWLSVIFGAMPESTIVAPQIGWLVVLPCATIALVLGLFVQTALVARLIAHVLLYKPRPTGEANTPQAARARQTARSAEPETNGAASMALRQRLVRNPSV